MVCIRSYVSLKKARKWLMLYIDGLAQYIGSSTANALEIPQSCAISNPGLWFWCIAILTAFPLVSILAFLAGEASMFAIAGGEMGLDPVVTSYGRIQGWGTLSYADWWISLSVHHNFVILGWCYNTWTCSLPYQHNFLLNSSHSSKRE